MGTKKAGTLQSGGLPCPACEQHQTQVIDSRASVYNRRHGHNRLDTRIRRRRKCLACGHRFTTEERYRDAPLDAELSISERLRDLAAELDEHDATTKSDVAA